MASRWTSLLLCLAVACLASVIVHSEARFTSADFALSKADCEKELLLAAQVARSKEAAAADTLPTPTEEQAIVNTASTKRKKKKKKKSPPKRRSPRRRSRRSSPRRSSDSTPSPSTPRNGGGGSGSILLSSGGVFSKVQDAIDAAKEGDTITIRGGDYREKVVISSSLKGLRLIGLGFPRIHYFESAKEAGSTLKSASVSVFADNFYCSGIVFENTFGFPDGKEDGQAVALLANGDNQVFENCRFFGHQDTLGPWQGTQVFRRCFIQGSIDYIFGASRAIFEGCTMRTIGNGEGDYTAVAAHFRTSPDQDTGFAFIGGSVAGYNRMWIGRLWGPYCRIIYSGTDIKNARSAGWTIMAEDYTDTARVGGVNVDSSGWVDWALTGEEASAELSKFT